VHKNLTRKNNDTAKSPKLRSATMAANGTSHQGSWVLLQAMNDGQVRNDICVVRDYVKNNLFEKSVVVWHKSALAKNGVFHKDYMKNCRALIADGHLMVISSKEAEGYMNMLWKRVEKFYITWMAKKRSGLYQAILDGFMSEWLSLVPASYVVTVGIQCSHLLAWLYCF
jgi:hypothetical protein